MEIQLTRLTSSDVKSLQDISMETFVETYSKDNTKEDMQIYLDDSFGYDKLLSELNDPQSAFYFAKAESEIVGYLKLNTGNAQTHMAGWNSLELARIYVRKKFQGQQIGKILVHKTIEYAKEQAVDFVWLGVWEHNPTAIRFYERNGFIKHSTHTFMLGKDLQTDFIMKLNIKQ